jgi:curved DNA-binding protein
MRNDPKEAGRLAARFVDYYKMLGVERNVSPEDLQKAYRKLARRYHPDISDEADAEERFKEVGEAYEVLKDPEARAHYDKMGYRSGQNVNPPPGWSGAGNMGGDFSDFFRMHFGDRMHRGFRREVPRHEDIFGQMFGGPPTVEKSHVTISLREACSGTERELVQRRRQPTPHGGWREVEHRAKVRIPAGATDGTTLRLRGQGAESPAGRGDLLLTVKIAPDDTFRLEGHDLHVEVFVDAWEAALGGEVVVPTLEGDVSMKIPAGVQPDQKLRLRRKGLPRKGGERGNLYARVRVRIPKNLSDCAKELWEALASESDDDD